jgi:hypothetical protein
VSKSGDGFVRAIGVEPAAPVNSRGGEKELKSASRRRAALRILGGGALSVACLGLLLARLGRL